MTPPRRMVRRPWFLASAATALVVVALFGGWQWRQQAGEAAVATTRTVVDRPVETATRTVVDRPVKPAPRELEERVLAANKPVPRPRVALPQALDAPPPAPTRVSTGGLPPVDPNNPFSARRFQSSHQFLDLDGVARDAP